MESEKAKFEYDLKQAKAVMDFNNVESILVTSRGDFFLESAEGFCKQECTRLNLSYKLVKKNEVVKDKKVDGKPGKSFSKMTSGELIQFAKDNSIEIVGKTNAEMVTEIEAALAKIAADQESNQNQE